MMPRVLGSILCLIILAPSPCLAYKPAPPERRDVFSPNRLFVLDFNPDTNIHTVYATANRKKPLWSYSAPAWLGPVFLSNDGRVVAVLAWKHVQIDGLGPAECVGFWDRTGKFKSYTFGTLCPEPRSRWFFEVGPVGSFWRVWYSSADQKGDELRVATTDLHEYTFSMKDGSILDERLLVMNLIRRYWLFGVLSVGLSVVAFVAVRRIRRRGSRPGPAPMPEGLGAG
jgi:hypothetical protein